MCVRVVHPTATPLPTEIDGIPPVLFNYKDTSAMKTQEELNAMTKPQLIAYYATLALAGPGIEVGRKAVDATVDYDETKHMVLGICDQDCISQLQAIGKPIKVRVSNTKNANGKNYANVSQESADMLWKYTNLFATEQR